MGSEKLEFTDLLISVLREHEKTLDTLISDLKAIVLKIDLDHDPRREIYGSLVYIGLDGDGNIHIMIRKQSSESLSKVVNTIKRNFEGSEVKIRFDNLQNRLT